MYHLPLLPGYGPNTNVRSAAPAKMKTGKSFLAHLSEAEENGYQGTYFTSPAARSATSLREGYISSTSPVDTRKHPSRPSEPQTPTSEMPQTPASEQDPFATDTEMGAETDAEIDARWRAQQIAEHASPPATLPEDAVAEVVFFDYGVVVFFGLEEGQERDILDDIDSAGIMKRKIDEEAWEIEECHFAVRRPMNLHISAQVDLPS